MSATSNIQSSAKVAAISPTDFGERCHKQAILQVEGKEWLRTDGVSPQCGVKEGCDDEVSNVGSTEHFESEAEGHIRERPRQERMHSGEGAPQ